jgi:hypothetical protein
MHPLSGVFVNWLKEAVVAGVAAEQNSKWSIVIIRDGSDASFRKCEERAMLV